jgi:hypothetical protein
MSRICDDRDGGAGRQSLEAGETYCSLLMIKSNCSTPALEVLL